MPFGAHACHQALLVPLEPAASSPCRHVAPQLVRFARRVVRGHHGELHHLFLKKGERQASF
jgi:hypothetical protein